MPITPARARFRAQLARPDPQVDAADAALAVAWEDRGHGDPDAALARLDEIAGLAAARLRGADHPPTIVAALNTFLFEDMGFRGNTWAYGDVRNSYLDDVIETRAGLPITLSLIYTEVARRLSLPIVGVALPGHFIVRYLAAEGSIFVDPFHRGRIWSYAECETQARLYYGQISADLMRDVLEPPSPRAVVARMLRNLKSAYLERGDHRRALAAVERILIAEGHVPAELRDRGLLRARLGSLALALEDLESYARMLPAASDMDSIRRHAAAIAEKIGRLS